MDLFPFELSSKTVIKHRNDDSSEDIHFIGLIFSVTFTNFKNELVRFYNYTANKNLVY